MRTSSGTPDPPERLRRLKPDSGSQLADHKASCVKSASQQSLKEAACVAVPSPLFFFSHRYCDASALRRFADTPGLPRTSPDSTVLRSTGPLLHKVFAEQSHHKCQAPIQDYTVPSAAARVHFPSKGHLGVLHCYGGWDISLSVSLNKHSFVCIFNA